MKAINVLFFLFSALQWLHSQDSHFTQIDKTISFLNPSMVGNFEGFGKITLQNRNQWINSGTSFSTAFCMGELTIGKKKRNLKPYTGLGTYFLNDIGGTSNYGIRTFGIAASGNIPFSRNYWFSGGINVSMNQQVIDLSKITFLSQWNGTIIDPSISSGENTSNSGGLFPDAGAGLAFNYKNDNDDAFNGKDLKMQAGISLQHLNKPKINFSSLERDNMKVKLLVHSLFNISISNASSIELSFAHFFQGPHRETIIGSFIKTKIKESSHFTSLISAQYFTFGSYFRSTLDICPYFSIDLGALRASFSYDVNLRNVTRGSYRHSFELQLAYQLTKNRTLKF